MQKSWPVRERPERKKCNNRRRVQRAPDRKKDVMHGFARCIGGTFAVTAGHPAEGS